MKLLKNSSIKKQTSCLQKDGLMECRLSILKNRKIKMKKKLVPIKVQLKVSMGVFTQV